LTLADIYISTISNGDAGTPVALWQQGKKNTAFCGIALDHCEEVRIGRPFIEYERR
jgi:hypothetical protein